MNLELNQFSATLAAGTYLLVVVALLLESARPGTFRNEANKDRKLPRPILAAVLAFALGIVLERVSDRVAEPEWSRFGILESDPDIRTRVFRKSFESEFAKWPRVVAAISGSRAQDPANPIYYEGKSAVFEVPSYADDLFQIQTHIRFIRSFASVSWFGMIGVLIVTAIRAIGWTCWLHRRPFQEWFAEAHVEARWRGMDLFKCCVIASTLYLFWLLSREAFSEEEVNYDKRVYGYYLHLLREGRAGTALTSPDDARAVASVQRLALRVRTQDHVCAGDASFPYSFGSGLAYAGRSGAQHEFLVLTDRGPTFDGPPHASSAETTIMMAPEFVPSIARVRWEPGIDPQVVVSTPLSIDGRSASGAPVRRVEGDAIMSLAAGGTELVAVQPSALGLDPEDIALEHGGSLEGGGLWICDEYHPAIFRVGAYGRLSRPLTPANGGLPDSFRHHEPNRGLEGIAIAQGWLFVALQSPCLAPGSSSPRELEPFLRIARCRVENAVAALETGTPVRWDEFAYAIPSSYAGKPGDWLISDLDALSDHEVAVLERYREGGAHRSSISVVDVSQCAPGAPGQPPLAQRVPIVDLGAFAGWMDAKPEGLCLIDDSTLVVSSDSDFGLASGASASRLDGSAHDAALDECVLRQVREGVYAVHAPSGERLRLAPVASGDPTAFWVIPLPAPILGLRDVSRSLHTAR